MKMNQSQGRSLNETFNDFVRMRGNRAVSSGSSPDDLDAHLSYEQRQTKEDLLKIAHHNPEEVLAGRIAPLNIETKKLSNIVRKQKEHVNRLLLHIQIEQIRSYFAAMQSQIQEILDHLRELRLALLKAIQANTDLLDLVETALQDKQIGRADGGTFINQALQHMTQAYMERHDIPPEAMRDFTDEQMLAMVEEQSEQVTAMNITMSDQIGVIDQTEKDLITLSELITQKEEMLDSDVPDDIKKQAVSNFYDELDLTRVEDHIKRITLTVGKVPEYKDILDLSDELRMNKVHERAKALSVDSLMSKL